MGLLSTAINNAQANANAAPGITPSNTGAAAGTLTSTGGLTTSGDFNTAAPGNKAGSVNTAAQTPAARMISNAGNNADAATAAATICTSRQCNVAVNASTNTTPPNTVQ